MRIALIENGVVVNVCEAGAEWAAANSGVVLPEDSFIGIGWNYNDGIFSAPSILAAVVTVDAITSAVQEHLDATVQAKGYDNILACISYLSSTNPFFAAEATAALNWRDAVWTYCYQELTKWQSGTRVAPETVALFIAELPVIVW